MAACGAVGRGFESLWARMKSEPSSTNLIDPSSVEKKVMSFISVQKKRVENKEITGATLSSFLKAIRLLLEMSEVNLNWKKIRRMLPRARRYAVDRVPIIEERSEERRVGKECRSR